MIYFVGSEHGTKIGIARDPLLRLDQLQANSPVELWLVDEVDACS